MKKTIFFLLAVLVMQSNAVFGKDLQSNIDEFSFVSNFYKILYEYDKNAVNFAEKGCKIYNRKDLITLFELQKKSLDDTEQSLLVLEPTNEYIQVYNTVLKGLKHQKVYLINVCKKMNSGLTFELAFEQCNDLFFSARDTIKQGCAMLASKINNYHPVYQFKILATAGVTEQELLEDMAKSEKIQSIQDLKN